MKSNEDCKKIVQYKEILTKNLLLTLSLSYFCLIHKKTCFLCGSLRKSFYEFLGFKPNVVAFLLFLIEKTFLLPL